MARVQVAYAAACMAVIGGSLCYMLCDFGRWPLLIYEPYERTWMVASQAPSAAAMLFPGMLVWGLCGGLVSAALGLIVLPRRQRELGSATIALLGAWALSSVAFTALYFLWGLWPF